MKRQVILIKTVFLLITLGVSSAFAQPETKQPAETSFEVFLQIVVAAKDGRTEVPSNLSNAVKKLKSTYDPLDFRLRATYIERTSNDLACGANVRANPSIASLMRARSFADVVVVVTWPTS